ncbi:MAG: DUF4388 domain-containing protein [Acidobacteria bacterium]|nr:DUF4388 domain-containing protein [Acidobacteriota bacterium]
MISEKGTLKETPVMKLLLGIFEQTLTGILYLKNEEILKVLYFNRGKLIWAISNSNEDKLENILAARDIVDPASLLKIKREAHVSESIGKILVEKGLITLEELIESSKIQLKRIIISILKWKVGGFQFVKDAPPERLLSLDLSIINFIIDFILDEMEISNIWKEIGSLQVELMKNPDEEKLNKYRLSEKQLILLNSFTGKDKLETVLSRYSGRHRESLLKIIYFFLMSGLLIKKEFELADSSVFEEPGDTTFDYLHPDKPKQTEKKPAETNLKQPENPAESFMSHSQEVDESLSQDVPPGSIDVEGPIDNGAKIKKIKMASLILVIFILLLGGTILLILPHLLNDNPMDKMKSASNISPAEEKIINVEERKPMAAKLEEPKIDTQFQPEPDKKAFGDLEKVEEEKGNLEEPKLPPGKSALAYFLEGNLITAGDIWRQELINTGIAYSILLELDCRKESVIDAFDRLENKDGFFILNKPAGEQICFLVLWGKYRDKKDAEAGLKLIPKYFWQQPDHPGVIEVTKYLKIP